MIKSFKHTLALKLDSVGFVASTLCAIHCAAMPFIIIFLSIYGFQFIASPLFEYLFIGLSILIGFFTFNHGYFNHHRKIYPIIIFTAGLTIVVLGHLFFHDHKEMEVHNSSEIIFLMITPIGAFLIGFAHYMNRKLSKERRNKVCRC